GDFEEIPEEYLQ
nr:Chain I, Hirudin I [Hirudo medicinalis]1BMN_I Chain I, Hirudin I [Hirudo medicinalis]1FPH_I Chain I, Hirudin [synthetic construct]1LHC_I Chain I, Hirudin [Hirudo medicinalis]1LHD_I Chain I, Hirudin [Hirudo medicinalis]1LHE_I Chain I, Hirudin [Hirudo medicinalis]1LHF_I Chain I, Hirudin [Hirudo medicinalis]1LHG_I Chain I, Hirudin [Hirudo medicinalis]